MHVRLLHEAARVHHGDVVRGTGHDAEVMGDQGEPGAGLPLREAQDVEDLRLHGGVERGGGFVGHKDARPVGDQPADAVPPHRHGP
ncbi:hypothetical protein ACIG3E_15435 [Streptomyces sp. NPDC053474]|uniref:hypothetical protein n=1 Tax=Streptomyces sp. NPDC053474 TaxID=3365704 RepID=UPI0037CF336B